MRIVQAVGWYFPDSLGGTEVYVGALAHQLRRRGHEVLVAAPDAANTTERHYEHDGIPVYRYPIPAAPSREEARGLTRVRGAEFFHRWLRAARPEVVHFHTFVTGLGLAEVTLARELGARVIVTTHSASLGFLCERGTMLRDGRSLCDAQVSARTCAACVLEQHGVPAPMAGLLAGMGRAVPGSVPRTGRLGTALDLERLVAARRAAHHQLFTLVDKFVVLSAWARAVLIANGAPPDQVTVNRLGIATRPGGWPRKAPPEDVPTTTPLTVGYLGRAEAVKGLDDLVHAVLALPASAPVRLRAVVVATGPAERRELAALKRAARRDPRVVFEPPRAPRDVPAWLASIDVLCCPSRVVEGGPTVALEAHAVGTPVIGSNLPALAEIVEPGVTGMLVAAGNRRALTALLASLAMAPGQLDEWRRRLPRPRQSDAVTMDYLAEYQA